MTNKLRVVSYNLGGGIKRYKGAVDTMPLDHKQALAQLIHEYNADVLCVQEVAEYTDAEGLDHSMMNQISRDGGYEFSFYGETLSMSRHMQVKKDIMVDALFKDWLDWSKGNALFSRYPFTRLGDTQKSGDPRNVPIFQPLSYEGTRDSDPRYVILARIQQPPFPYVVNLHLTTLVGERQPHAWDDIRDAAHQTRAQQLKRVLDLVQRNIIDKGEPLVLAGDFNALPDEYNIKEYLEKECGFVRLEPSNPMATHAVAGMVDHIFFSPASRLVSYECSIDDSPTARIVSDHLPVIADLEIN